MTFIEGPAMTSGGGAKNGNNVIVCRGGSLDMRFLHRDGISNSSELSRASKPVISSLVVDSETHILEPADIGIHRISTPRISHSMIRIIKKPPKIWTIPAMALVR